MQARFVTGLLVLAFAAAASAQEANSDAWNHATGSVTRQQVQAELAQTRQTGAIETGAVNYDFVGAAASTKTREQVRAELLAARNSGEHRQINAEAAAPSAPAIALQVAAHTR